MHIDTLLIQTLYFKQTCLTCGLVPDMEGMVDFCSKMVDVLDIDPKEKRKLIEQVLLVEDASYEYISGKLDGTSSKKKKSSNTKKLSSKKIKFC